MSKFRDACLARQPLFDRHMGERLRVVHVLRGEFLAGQPDPAKPAFEAVGVLDRPEEVAAPAGTSDGAKSDVVMMRAQVEFDPRQFGTDRPCPVAGTEIHCLDVPAGTTERYRVAAPLSDGAARIAFRLDRI